MAKLYNYILEQSGKKDGNNRARPGKLSDDRFGDMGKEKMMKIKIDHYQEN